MNIEYISHVIKTPTNPPHPQVLESFLHNLKLHKESGLIIKFIVPAYGVTMFDLTRLNTNTGTPIETHIHSAKDFIYTYRHRHSSLVGITMDDIHIEYFKWQNHKYTSLNEVKLLFLVEGVGD